MRPLHADLVAPGNGETLHVFAGFIVERSDLDRVLGLPVRWFTDPVHVAWVRVQGERTFVAEGSDRASHEGTTALRPRIVPPGDPFAPSPALRGQNWFPESAAQ